MSGENNSLQSHITAQTTLIPAIQSWEHYLDDQGKSPYTVKAFTGDLNLLASYLPPDKTIGSITTNDLNRFLQWMQKGRGVPCSPKSLARRITSIKAFFRWLRQFGIVVIDPAEKVVQKSVISPLPSVLTAEEEQSILDVARTYRIKAKPDARYYTLVNLLLISGIKKGECLSISLNHIDLDSPDGPTLFIRYTDPRYRYKERKIPLTEDWVSSYQEYMSQYNPDNQLFPWSPRRLEYLLEDLSNESNIGKRLSFDMCRWTCALNDYNAGMETEKIRQKLGVSKIQWREINMKLRNLSSNLKVSPDSPGIA